jgi:hypothetical protein
VEVAMIDGISTENTWVPQRLCWWRDPESGAFDGLPEEKATDSDARYRYELAQAELQFAENLDFLGGIPLSGNELFLAGNVERYTQEFLCHTLSAFGDLLLDRRIPAVEARQEFNRHADELLNDTFNRKWLSGLRRLELMEDPESSEGPFRPTLKIIADGVRRAFEKLLWTAEIEDVGSPIDLGGTRQCDGEPQTVSPKQKRGPKPKIEEAHRIAAIVERFPNWKSELPTVCGALDDENIPVTKSWKEDGYETWSEQADNDRELVRKAINNALNRLE